MEWEIIARSNKKRSIQHYSWIQAWATGGTRCFKAYRVSIHFSHALFFKIIILLTFPTTAHRHTFPIQPTPIPWTPQMSVSTSCEEATDALLLFTEISQESQNQPTLLWNPVSACHWNIIEVYGLVIVIVSHGIYGTLSSSAGSSSFESQKMDRPSISVMSPTSPGALRELPLLLPGQLSVSVWGSLFDSLKYAAHFWLLPRKVGLFITAILFCCGPHACSCTCPIILTITEKGSHPWLW